MACPPSRPARHTPHEWFPLVSRHVPVVADAGDGGHRSACRWRARRRPARGSGTGHAAIAPAGRQRAARRPAWLPTRLGAGDRRASAAAAHAGAGHHGRVHRSRRSARAAHRCARSHCPALQRAGHCPRHGLLRRCPPALLQRGQRTLCAVPARWPRQQRGIPRRAARGGPAGGHRPHGRARERLRRGRRAHAGWRGEHDHRARHRTPQRRSLRVSAARPSARRAHSSHLRHGPRSARPTAGRLRTAPARRVVARGRAPRPHLRRSGGGVLAGTGRPHRLHGARHLPWH